MLFAIIIERVDRHISVNGTAVADFGGKQGTQTCKRRVERLCDGGRFLHNHIHKGFFRNFQRIQAVVLCGRDAVVAPRKHFTQGTHHR